MKNDNKTQIINKIDNSAAIAYISNIKTLLIDGFDDSKKTIFLCGKDKSDRKSLRYKFSHILSKEKNIKLTYPEDLFEDLLEGQGKNSLLSLETQLANSVDLIIMLPESPGSFAELGAFSMDKSLACKMLVLRLNKYKTDKSFINHGPIRLIRYHGGHIHDIPTDFDVNNIMHVSNVMSFIRKILPSGRKKKDIDNLLLYNNHILTLIFLFDEVTLLSIYKIMEKIMSRKFEYKDNLACKAATHSLIRSGYIIYNNDRLELTSDGYNFIMNNFHMKSALTELRARIMNQQLARQ